MTQTRQKPTAETPQQFAKVEDLFNSLQEALNGLERTVTCSNDLFKTSANNLFDTVNTLTHDLQESISELGNSLQQSTISFVDEIANLKKGIVEHQKSILNMQSVWLDKFSGNGASETTDTKPKTRKPQPVKT